MDFRIGFSEEFYHFIRDYPPEDLAKAILMQQFFCVGNRTTAGLILLFKEKMRIRRVFSYKTLERAYSNPIITRILYEVFRLTQEPVKDKEHSFSIDGTGLPISMLYQDLRDHHDDAGDMEATWTGPSSDVSGKSNYGMVKKLNTHKS